MQGSDWWSTVWKDYQHVLITLISHLNLIHLSVSCHLFSSPHRLHPVISHHLMLFCLRSSPPSLSPLILCHLVSSNPVTTTSQPVNFFFLPNFHTYFMSFYLNSPHLVLTNFYILHTRTLTLSHFVSKPHYLSLQMCYLNLLSHCVSSSPYYLSLLVSYWNIPCLSVISCCLN